MTVYEFMNNLGTITNSAVKTILEIMGADVNVTNKNIDDNCFWRVVTTNPSAHQMLYSR